MNCRFLWLENSSFKNFNGFFFKDILFKASACHIPKRKIWLKYLQFYAQLDLYEIAFKLLEFLLFILCGFRHIWKRINIKKNKIKTNSFVGNEFMTLKFLDFKAFPNFRVLLLMKFWIMMLKIVFPEFFFNYKMFTKGELVQHLNVNCHCSV